MPHDVLHSGPITGLPVSALLNPRLFNRAYDSSVALQNYVSEKDLAQAKAALTIDLTANQQFPRLNSLLAQLDDSEEAVQIARALILIYVRSQKHKPKNMPQPKSTRKYSPEPSYIHSPRVAEMALSIAEGLITARSDLAIMVQKALLHDGMEDFGISFDTIKNIFGGKIANSISRMTTPDILTLALAYPDVPSNLFGKSIAPEEMEEYIQHVKESDRELYRNLKTQLKLRYKCHQAKFFDLDEVIIKACDNIDAFASTIRDAVEKNIRIYAQGNLGVDPRKVGSVYLFPLARLKRDLLDRTTYHVTSLALRIQELSKTAPNDMLAPISQIQDRLDAMFEHNRTQLEVLIKKTDPLNYVWKAATGILNRTFGPALRKSGAALDRLSGQAAMLSL